MPENQNFKYDVFLSHSAKDKLAVRELAERLKTDGLHVWFDEWEIRPGDRIGEKTEEGLDASRVLVLCMSQHAFGSDWLTLESGTFRFRDSANKQRRFMPLLLEDVELKEPLRQFAHVDWRKRSPSEYARLARSCRPIEAKPEAPGSILASLKARRISLGHTDRVFSVALCADGRRALSGSGDKAVRVWDVESGRCVATLIGHTDRVVGVGWLTDNRRALSWSFDQALRVWDVENAQCVAVWKGHTDRVLAVGLSPDGRHAISGSTDRTVRVWDVESGQCLAVLEGHSSRVWAVALSSDSKRALSGSDDNTVRLWDVGSGRCLATLRGHTDRVFAVALSADGRRAVSGSHDRTVRIWDAEAGQCLATLQGHIDSVISVALTADGHRALSGSCDGTVRVWDVETGRSLGAVQGRSDDRLGVGLNAGEHRLFWWSAGRVVRITEVETGRRLATLEGHTDTVNCVALSANGSRLITGSADQVLRVWDAENGNCKATLAGHSGSIHGVALSSDGRRAVSGSVDKTARVWDIKSGKCLAVLQGHHYEISAVALNGNGHRALSGSLDGTARVWDVKTGKCLAILHGHRSSISGVTLSGDGRRALSGSSDKGVRLWDAETGRCVALLKGHTDGVFCVAMSEDGRRAISGSSDRTLRVWDLESERCLATLEGHTDRISSVAWSGDGRRALSGSLDGTVRVWDVESGGCLGTLEGHIDRIVGVAMARSGRRALVVGEKGIARIFEFPTVLDIAQAALDGGSRYTNAKVLLVGETGVGKSGLAIRLSQKRFEPTASTDGHWATQLPLPNESGTGGRQREIWLWDFAGQADYRLMHQLFMDETALAVLVFNPQSENPFEGLGEWDRDLQRAARRPFKKLLVAGRCDRGGLMISRRIVERFRQERGFSDYIETSALQGTGCEKLCEAIIRQIPWNDIPWTASPRIFRLLKDEVIKLKDEGRVLLRMSELKQQLELRLPGESFSLEELRAVVGLLAGPGIVWQLEFGDFVLVQPERANAYAAAVIRSVRAHTEEIGCIAEEDVLVGKLDFQDMKRLPPEEEQIVLRAMHQTFVDHGLCLREHTEKGTLLIFPSYFKRERPELKAHPLVLVTYQFNGPLDEIYATLVVRLHYTAPFEKDRLWRFAADFKTESGKRLGLKMTKKGEGTGELELYFESGIANDVQVMFIRYVHEHLKLKAQDVCRLRHYVCPHCHEPVENRRAIDKRLSEGKKDILCGACERRVELVDLIEEKFASEEFLRRVCELEEQAKVAIDNESRELILVGHTYAIAGEAGQIYRQYTNSDHGIDGEIEFKDYEGKASGKRLYLQLKSGDSYLYQRKEDGVEVFTIKNERLADYWQKQAYPVMLVIRISDGTIRWMDISEYLKRESRGGEQVKQVVFKGEPLTALSVRQMRDRFVPLPKSG